MATIEITNNDLGSVEVHGGEFDDDILAFASAGTVRAGTILARNTSTKRLVPYVKGGVSNGDGVPHSVLTYDVTATGAADVPIRPLLKGTVKLERLVIHADGDAQNVDTVEVDGLRSMGILARSATQLGRHDNPQGEGGADS